MMLTLRGHNQSLCARSLVARHCMIAMLLSALRVIDFGGWAIPVQYRVDLGRALRRLRTAVSLVRRLPHG